jgi:hypothetical protein
MPRLTVKIKKMVPPPLLNRLLLTFPFLYELPIVRYESNIGVRGLNTVTKLLETVIHLDGNLIECGASRCGTTVVMAQFLRAKGSDKHIFVLDSFEGFPPEEVEHERAEGLNTSGPQAFTSTSLDYVQAKFKALRVAEYITPIKGFFQDTLESVDSDWCFAFIDCDLRDSLVYCAERIWPRLSSGGCILFDDYNSVTHRGAVLGVDKFVQDHIGEISDHKNLFETEGGRGYLVRKK